MRTVADVMRAPAVTVELATTVQEASARMLEARAHAAGANPPRARVIVVSVSDIETRDDCERLVRAFYARAMSDPMIGFLFVDVARLDLEAHVPRITAFWETILLGGRSYGGGAFAPHARLHAKVPLRGGHFARWLELWTATVDELFEGERAELAKAHARRVASAFHGRLQGYAPPPPDAAAGVTVTMRRPG